MLPKNPEKKTPDTHPAPVADLSTELRQMSTSKSVNPLKLQWILHVLPKSDFQMCMYIIYLEFWALCISRITYVQKNNQSIQLTNPSSNFHWTDGRNAGRKFMIQVRQKVSRLCTDILLWTLQISWKSQGAKKGAFIKITQFIQQKPVRLAQTANYCWIPTFPQQFRIFKYQTSPARCFPPVFLVDGFWLLPNNLVTHTRCALITLGICCVF